MGCVGVGVFERNAMCCVVKMVKGRNQFIREGVILWAMDNNARKGALGCFVSLSVVV